MIVRAGHRLIVHKRIHDCFFRRLHDAAKDRVHQIVWDRLDRMGNLIWIGNVGIRRRKGDKQVAGPISRNTAGARETEGRATREPFELIRQQRRIGRDHDDARTSLFLINGARNFFADRDARNCQ